MHAKSFRQKKQKQKNKKFEIVLITSLYYTTLIVLSYLYDVKRSQAETATADKVT